MLSDSTASMGEEIGLFVEFCEIIANVWFPHITIISISFHFQTVVLLFTKSFILYPL